MGELARKGESRPATQGDLAVVERARALQALQQVPVLQRAGNPHEYLFFALFDGTGQDAGDPTQRPTNVGLLSKQAALLALDPAHRVGYKYVEGIGTQPNPLARYADAWIPYTWDDRIEEAYRALAEQTRQWQQHAPDARVRLVAVGYSRGAVLAAGLTRLVDRYGIADPEGLTFGRDAHGRITVVAERPPLLAPGQVAQAMGLFDPVATHLPAHYDARRAPSVISAMALAAVHERREAFPHQAILEPGLSADRRFVNLPMPGGHADVGGGNRDPGLETLAFNAMADYLNGLRDRPLFAYRPLPDDPRLYTIHQVRGLTAVPGLDGDGLRDLRRELADCRTVDPCRDGEPVDQALAARFAYRRQPPTAPLPSLADLRQEAAGMSKAALPVDLRDPAHPGHLTYTRTLAAVQRMEASRGKRWPRLFEQLSPVR
ncbi:T6SS phospholipase effector Tle1-like catalytic domain-containing protein [Vulcaniibacterium gelatinicum]|uniref:phospholipase effector Tle1 domain-containing protein n=1 Tax=Vulcaniibacterium gelatinicum TaxID=2598725 RepID=UPI0011CABBD0|nr:DUF2235 domain-containing protein [Vulcaniibacterium gelatinicum]